MMFIVWYAMRESATDFWRRRVDDISAVRRTKHQSK